MSEMSESEFNQRIDDLLTGIEDAVEASGLDIDYETVGGILTLGFENGTQIIINRQAPLRQVWVAAKSGGFHFNYDAAGARWVNDNTGEELFSALSGWCSAQSGEAVSLEAP